MTPAKTTTEKPVEIAIHKRFTGIVASNKMKDTIVVVVERFEKHQKYQKYLRLRKRFKVDDKGNTAKVGDQVIIEETKPISKEKHFKLVEVLVHTENDEVELPIPEVAAE